MAEIRLTCPECGDPIAHSCDTNQLRLLAQIPAQNVAQIAAQNEHQAQIAHVSKSLRSESSPKKSRGYNQGYDQGFLLFWEVYPRKRDKRKAQMAWRNAIRRANADAIYAGAVRYRDDPNRIDEYTKYAEGWLNGDGWEDEPLPSRNGERPRDRAAEIFREAVAKRGSLPG